MEPNRPDNATDNVISAPEAEAQLRYVERAFTAGNDEERQNALIDGLLTFGVRFVWLWMELGRQTEESGFVHETGQELTILFASWLKGRTLSTRADEPERRAAAALQVLDGPSQFANLTHYAAQAILELPDSHPMRDVAKVRDAVHAQIAAFQQQEGEMPWVFASSALALAYNQRFGTDEELIGWESWAEKLSAHLDPDDAEQLWGAIEGFYIELAGRDGPQWRERAARARSRVNQSQLSRKQQSMSDLRQMFSAIADDDQLQAAERLRQALESGTFEPHVERMMAVKEARVRLAHDQFDRTIDLLEPRLDQYEEDYITSIRTEVRQSKGEDFGEACATLAFARAAVGRWEEAIEALERGKCARQRYTRALRRTPEAAQLLELEAELYAVSRGLPPDRPIHSVERVQDWLAQGLSPETQLQEQYRQLLPTLDASTWRAPRMDDIRHGLRDGEAALSLGLSWAGLLAAIIVRDRPRCLHTIRRADVTESRLVEYLSSNERGEDGFLIALERGDGEEGPRKTLAQLVDFLDKVIGGPIADVLSTHGIRRLAVIPHRFLRLTPLWALASWMNLEVRMVPDAASLAGESGSRPMPRTALLVTNPTLDLPMASTEGAMTTGHLDAARFDTRTLAGVSASEGAIVEQLQGVGLLHFAGHGHAALTDDTLSALLVSPEWSRAGMDNAGSLVALASASPEAPHLVIDKDEGSPRRKVYYEYSRSGTLFVDAINDEVAVAGELWRAGDILVRGSLEGCSLAFLCACSSGLGSISSLDEATGLPAALDLSGVRSVVSTGWPVADTLALLFADEFYRRALAKNVSTMSVLAAVRSAADLLRTMDRNDAAARVETFATNAADAAARFRLRSYAKRLRSGPPRPFEHPFDWGAFFVTGAAEIPLAAESRDGPR